jgi:hypothetical protein
VAHKERGPVHQWLDTEGKVDINDDQIAITGVPPIGVLLDDSPYLVETDRTELWTVRLSSKLALADGSKAAVAREIEVPRLAVRLGPGLLVPAGASECRSARRCGGARRRHPCLLRRVLDQPPANLRAHPARTLRTAEQQSPGSTPRRCLRVGRAATPCQTSRRRGGRGCLSDRDLGSAWKLRRNADTVTVPLGDVREVLLPLGPLGLDIGVPKLGAPGRADQPQRRRWHPRACSEAV